MRSKDPRFSAPSPEIDGRVRALIHELTLEEKIQLLGGKPGSGGTQGNARVGIPELKLADGPMGVHWWCDASTAYPAAVAAAASFDTELWYRLGRALGRDCRARGVHILLAPGVNLYRSPLSGRNFEYAGEDPFLAARFAVQYISGVQDQGVSCTVKHYAVNFQEYSRHHISSDLDERTLHELYLPAFKAAVTEAGVGALMTAYNLVNGVHCSEHPALLLDILKGEWGFDGVAMSDWVSTYSALGPANAGLDLEMPIADWMNAEHLLPLVKRGEVKQSTIDDKLVRLLRLAACFGWLDHEQKDTGIPWDDPESQQVALDVARAGSVLLKNEGAVLPLARESTRTLAVIGPHAHPAVIGGGGSAYTTPYHSTSVLEGLRQLLGSSVEILHVEGPDPNPERAVYQASHFTSSHGKGLWGEYFNNAELKGRPVVERLDEHVDFHWGQPPMPQITSRLYSVRWTGSIRVRQSGQHDFYSQSHNSLYRVSLGGEVIIDTWERERNGTHRARVQLEAGIDYPVSVEWKKTRYSGGLQFGFRYSGGAGEHVAECVAAARQAGAAVVCVGFDKASEGEGFDRPFAMNEDLERMLIEVSKVQPRTVVVLTAGGNLDMERWVDGVPAVLHTWYPGQAGGQAVAELLYGLVNPSGRLPATFERRLSERSSFDCYHDEDGDHRVTLSDGIFGGYRHFDQNGIAPRFAFGHGLSYTSFGYEALALSQREVAPGEGLEVSLDIVNTGSRRGAEVVQVYVRDVACRLPRPPKELKAFTKVTLEPGERRRVTLPLGSEALQFYDPAVAGWVHEPGEFEVLVAASAVDVRLRARFVLAG